MILQTLITNVRSIVNSATIKFKRDATKYETVESKKAADLYMGAINKTDTLDTYQTLYPEAILLAGYKDYYSTYEIIGTPGYELVAKLRQFINPEHTENILEAQRKIIIRDYDELNEYYRILIGKPPIGTDNADYVYLTEDQETLYNVAHGTPLHLIDDDILYQLDSDGVLATIISENSTKKYLNYIGYRRVDLSVARSSNNFAILKLTKDIPDAFYQSFISLYEQCREYFSTTIYNSLFSSRYEYYDNFIGLCIMVMTIQRLVAESFKLGIQRNFYDWSFIEAMYNMYNIPLVENLNIDYHISILKNMNNLLRYKSTDKVLFDVCSLLGYERMNIFKYYLVKEHKTDDHGEPLFYYKKEYNSDGTYTLVEDKEKMYELYFQSVNIKERNVALALSDSNNMKSYSEVTGNDPYWWEESELKESIYNEEFNYMETKYLSLNIMYKMTKMLFEITYIFRLMIDRKDDLANITIPLPKLYQDKEFKIYDMIIAMICLLCKKCGFNDYTIITASKTAHVYGFNFNSSDINAIKSIIQQSRVIDKSIISYFENLEIETTDDVNVLFERIREYNDVIIDKMANSTTLDEYNTYRKIFDISIMTKVQEDMFTIEDDDGNSIIATSYLQYLEYNDSILADIIKNTVTDTISSVMEHMTAQLGDTLDNLKYLHLLNDGDSPLFRSITQLIYFFKSYTTDLAALNVLYVFDSKVYNMVKFIEDFRIIYSSMRLEDKLTVLDKLILHGKIRSSDEIAFTDSYNVTTGIFGESDINLEDTIQSILMLIDMTENINIAESLNIIGCIHISDIQKIYDVISSLGYIIDISDDIEYYDSYHIASNVTTDESLDMLYSENINSIRESRLAVGGVGVDDRVTIKYDE